MREKDIGDKVSNSLGRPCARRGDIWHVVWVGTDTS